MSNSTYELIREAMEKKLQVTATYKGYRREMCPHTLGTKNGRERALFYQFGGESSKGSIINGDPGNWRCIFIDELDSVALREGKWFTADNHSRRQTCIDEIDFEVLEADLR